MPVWRLPSANWDMPLPVSQSFLEETTAALSEVVVPASKQPPKPLRENFTRSPSTAKRSNEWRNVSKPLRSIGGSVIGRKALVAVDGLTGCFGHGSEPRRRQFGKLADPGLLERVRRASTDALFIADRNFGNLVQAEQFTDSGDHFIRATIQPKFTADRPAQPC